MQVFEKSVSHSEQLDQMAQLIDKAIAHDGSLEVKPGLILHRRSQQQEPLHAVSEPSFCMIAQGRKEVYIGDSMYIYDLANYLISTVQLPMMAKVVEASETKPYLGMQLILDPQIVTSILMEARNALPQKEGYVRAIDVSAMDEKLLDATLRLVRLTQSEDDYEVLAPLLKREITYWLLKSEQGNRLSHLARMNTQGQQMARAISHLKAHFDKSIKIADLAADLGMSVSTFHKHFKAVTAMSPIQYQKQLRLQEARRLMTVEHLDAAEAGFEVGYEDASHFSREYKRQFGLPPRKDVAAMLIAGGVG